MKTVLNNARYWISGTALALLGVLISNFSRFELSGQHRIVGVVCGELLGLAGLFVLCLGVSRRLRRANLG